MRPEQLYPAIIDQPADTRTNRQKDVIGLRLALIPTLTLWEQGCAPRSRDAAPIGPDLIGVYAKTLAGIGVTAAELEDAQVSMLETRTFFPSVAEIATWIKERRAGRIVGFIECVDDNGLSWLAPRDRVFDGKLVDDGGNGCACHPNEASRDLILRVRRQRREIGVERLVDALPEQMEEIGLRPGLAMPAALPPKTAVVTAERAAELIEEAKVTADSRRSRREEE